MPTKRADPDYRRGETRVTYRRRKRLDEVRRLMVAGFSRRDIGQDISRRFSVAYLTVIDDDIPEVNRQMRAEDAFISDASIARVVLEDRLLESRRQLSEVAGKRGADGSVRVSAIRARVDVDSRLADLQGVMPRGDDSGIGAFTLRLDLEPDPSGDDES